MSSCFRNLTKDILDKPRKIYMDFLGVHKKTHLKEIFSTNLNIDIPI